MENRKRNVQLIIRVTEEKRRLTERKMAQVPTMNLSAFARKVLIDGYIINLDFSEIKPMPSSLAKSALTSTRLQSV